MVYAPVEIIDQPLCSALLECGPIAGKHYPPAQIGGQTVDDPLALFRGLRIKTAPTFCVSFIHTSHHHVFHC